jgi:hypothetical protein
MPDLFFFKRGFRNCEAGESVSFSIRPAVQGSHFHQALEDEFQPRPLFADDGSLPEF